jgi:hypothetical protein
MKLEIFFANFQILGLLGCQGWVVIPQNVQKSQNHCTLVVMQGIYLSAVSSVNVQGVFILIASSVEMQDSSLSNIQQCRCAGLIPFGCLMCGLAGCIPFTVRIGCAIHFRFKQNEAKGGGGQNFFASKQKKLYFFVFLHRCETLKSKAKRKQNKLKQQKD